jgi:SAP domain-containing ribonucleoprotein
VISNSAKPAQTPIPPTKPQKDDTQPSEVSSNEKTVDNELEKRKQRAQRFGLEDSTANTPSTPVGEDEIKKSMRAKRFGITSELNVALDRPLADGKDASKVIVKSAADLEWEARKRKRAEKFGLVDNPPASTLKDGGFHRKNQKFNNNH